MKNSSLLIPTGFSPNGDGNNDFLKPLSNKPFEKLEFAVYDRWGEEVYRTSDPSAGWDGTFNGQKLGPAVFFYYCKATVDGMEFFMKGNVTLVR